MKSSTQLKSPPELTHHLLAFSHHQIVDTKALYMSGYIDNAIRHHGVLEEGVNYIQKPLALDALTRRVRQVLDQTG